MTPRAQKNFICLEIKDRKCSTNFMTLEYQYWNIFAESYKQISATVKIKNLAKYNPVLWNLNNIYFSMYFYEQRCELNKENVCTQFLPIYQYQLVPTYIFLLLNDVKRCFTANKSYFLYLGQYSECCHSEKHST